MRDYILSNSSIAADKMSVAFFEANQSVKQLLLNILRIPVKLAP
jgi:hypothetical protein